LQPQLRRQFIYDYLKMQLLYRTTSDPAENKIPFAIRGVKPYLAKTAL